MFASAKESTRWAVFALAALSTFMTACSAGEPEPAAGGGPAGPAGPGQAPPPVQERRVSVNGQALDAATLNQLESLYHLQIAAGSYWYDPTSGAAGPAGGPTLTFIVPGLRLGGPLRADASNGNTGVFVNGRELPAYDLAGLTRLVGYIAPGRYFLDAMGNAGTEGGPPTVNLLVASQRASGGGGGWYSSNAQAGGNEAGGTGYVMGKDASGNTWGASYGN
jgi:hypothetical protein